MTMLQIRNVPDDVHRALKSRAALAGMSLSEYALRHLSELVERPSRQELFERLNQLPRHEMTMSTVDVLRRERQDRLDHLDDVRAGG